MAVNMRGGARRVRGRQGQGSHGPLSEGQGREAPTSAQDIREGLARPEWEGADCGKGSPGRGKQAVKAERGPGTEG